MPCRSRLLEDLSGAVSVKQLFQIMDLFLETAAFTVKVPCRLSILGKSAYASLLLQIFQFSVPHFRQAFPSGR